MITVAYYFSNIKNGTVIVQPAVPSLSKHDN